MREHPESSLPVLVEGDGGSEQGLGRDAPDPLEVSSSPDMETVLPGHIELPADALQRIDAVVAFAALSLEGAPSRAIAHDQSAIPVSDRSPGLARGRSPHLEQHGPPAERLDSGELLLPSSRTVDDGTAVELAADRPD